MIVHMYITGRCVCSLLLETFYYHNNNNFHSALPCLHMSRGFPPSPPRMLSGAELYTAWHFTKLQFSSVFVRSVLYACSSLFSALVLWPL